MASVFDRRRIQGPEISYAPLLVSTELAAGPSRQRRPNDGARAIFLETGLISQANGSGYIETGGVKIACSVYGPRPKQPPYSPQGSLNLDIKFAPFASHPRRAPLRDTEPAPLSALLTSHLLPALQLHLLPKSALDVHLLILESDVLPNVLSAGLTVASAAIADAGIQMTALGIGVTVSQTAAGMMVDMDVDEEDEAASVSLGVMPALGQLSGVWLAGELEIDEACAMIEKGIAGSKSVHTVVAHTLLTRAEQYGHVSDADLNQTK